ncbi:hypothetical protein I7I51_03434 [Histoplasma capsulatum]|uniref:Amine oxidase domain-containing protein n=1 Tax=Ajellomyces capsulatus TaxID=5037 RepID=A0A8A1M5J4_AJECA|nr:hypothetical protein I7I51_03434 [Histoplasma capsulatum]
MRKPKENPRTTVAIIGSGMAGLVTGYLLKQDQSQQFDVQVFEMQDKISLDSASITAPTEDGKGVRVDLPMRAFAGGFYSNLRGMYKHLGVKYVPIQFLFPLSQVPGSRKSSLSSSHGRENDADCHGEGDDVKTIPSKPYFIHSSNNHRIPPVRPEHLGFWGWTTEYQSVSSLTGATRIEDASLAETLGEYLERIMLPTYFTQNYIIPQFSAVTTCSHDDLLKFPAKDLIEYSTQTYNVPYYVVQGGVNVVQKILAEGLNIQLNSRVISVESQSGPSPKVRVSYRVGGEGTLHQRDFDHAIMAVTPDVVGAIFQPLRSTMTHVPTTFVESIVHHDTSSFHPLSQTCRYGNKESNATSSYGYSSAPPPETQVIHVRSSPAGFTEAIHECARSIFVTTVPITPIDPSKIIHRTRFTRVLRTPQSKEVVNRIFGRDHAATGASEKSHQWRNGNVILPSLYLLEDSNMIAITKCRLLANA